MSDWVVEPYDFAERIPWIVLHDGTVVLGEKGQLHDDLLDQCDVIYDPLGDGAQALGEIVNGKAAQMKPMGHDFEEHAQDAYDEAAWRGVDHIAFMPMVPEQPAMVHQAPAQAPQAPAGTHLPTMQDTWGSDPQPSKPGYNWTYKNQQQGLMSASISLSRANIQAGHVAVWLGVENPDATMWLQAGIEMSYGQTEPHVYVEACDHPNGTPTYLSLGPIPLGRALTIKLQEVKGVWSILVNGKAYGRMSFGPSAVTAAMGESWNGANPNDYDVTIHPIERRSGVLDSLRTLFTPAKKNAPWITKADGLYCAQCGQGPYGNAGLMETHNETLHGIERKLGSDDWAPSTGRPDWSRYKFVRHIPSGQIHFENAGTPTYPSHGSIIREHYGPMFDWKDYNTGYAEVMNDSSGRPVPQVSMYEHDPEMEQYAWDQLRQRHPEVNWTWMDRQQKGLPGVMGAILSPATEKYDVTDLPRHLGGTRVADYQGWTNWETWNTALMMDNDYDLYQESRKLFERGLTVEQLRDWLIQKVIGPHNRDAIEDAKEWNSIPPEERLDYNFEDLKERSPQAADIVDQLGFGPDVSDSEPTLIDPELVNWQEIWNNLYSEVEDQIHSDQMAEKAKANGIEWYTPGTDPTTPSNLMYDAWMKHHGIMSQEQRLPNGSHAGYHTVLQLSDEQLPEGKKLNGDYWGRDPSAYEHADKRPMSVSEYGNDTIGDIQRGRANPYQIQTMQTALSGQGHSPERMQEIMRQRWHWNPETERWEDIEPRPSPSADPSLDQPGTLTLPNEWISKTGSRTDVLTYAAQLIRFYLNEGESWLHIAQGIPIALCRQFPGLSYDEAQQIMQQASQFADQQAEPSIESYQLRTAMDWAPVEKTYGARIPWWVNMANPNAPQVNFGNAGELHPYPLPVSPQDREQTIKGYIVNDTNPPVFRHYTPVNHPQYPLAQSALAHVQRAYLQSEDNPDERKVAAIERGRHVYHEGAPRDKDDSAWDVRTPYLYDQENDVIHWGVPGWWHADLRPKVEAWEYNNGVQRERSHVPGAIADSQPHLPGDDRPHAFYDRYIPEENYDDVKSRLEELVGRRMWEGETPDSIINYVYRRSPEESEEDEWAPKLGSDMGDLLTNSADSWHGPGSVRQFTVDVPGEAPGMGGIGHELDHPCFCDVGPTTPHEWNGSCENGQRPITDAEAQGMVPSGQTKVMPVKGRGFDDNQWDSDTFLEQYRHSSECRYFHVTPRKNRESILRHGIDPEFSDTWKGMNYPHVWAWDQDHYQRALDWGAGAPYPVDIWHVNPEGLEWITDPHAHDPEDPMYHGAWATSRIPPENLIQHEEYTEGGQPWWTRKAADNAPGMPVSDSGHWVWLDGQVGFGGEHHEIARNLAQQQGYDPDKVNYISNMVARNVMPEEHAVAVGTLRGGYPHIWTSTRDRNAVWDDVARAHEGMSKTATGEQMMYHIAPASSRGSIQQHGLDYSKQVGQNWREDYPWKAGEDAWQVAPAGQYLWASWPEAVNHHELANEDAPHDLWLVRPDGLDVQPDPWANYSDFSAYPDARYVTQRIAPEQLTLLTGPFEYDKPRTASSSANS